MKSFAYTLLFSVATFAGAKSIDDSKIYCTGCDAIIKHNNIYWGFENNQWCEISSNCKNENEENECFSYPLYPCCSECNVVGETDEGEWGIENGKWCGIKESCTISVYEEEEEDSYSEDEDNVRIIENGIIYPNDPYIYYVGRWDSENISQWSGSGFKLDFTGTSFTFVAGNRTQDVLTIAYSIDYQTLQYQNVTIGENILANGLEDVDHHIQLYVTSTDGNFLQMDRLVIDQGSKIHQYEPLDKYVQIVGDSLSAGQYSPNEAADAWSFLFGKYMNVEADIIAKPGICLSDIPLYGMDHGMEVSYFMTSNPVARAWGYNYDEYYDFSKRKEPDLMIIFLGTNDVSDAGKVTAEDYFETLKKFLTNVRNIYPNTPIAVTSLLNTPPQQPLWNEVQANIVNFFDNVYYIRVDEFENENTKFNLNNAPYIYLTNYHLTQVGHCTYMNGIVQKIKEQIGFEKQEMPSNKWGMHGNVATGYEICDHPHADSLVYHYSWEGFGGVGVW